jgi:hypothetical protein
MIIQPHQNQVPFRTVARHEESPREALPAQDMVTLSKARQPEPGPPSHSAAGPAEVTKKACSAEPSETGLQRLLNWVSTAVRASFAAIPGLGGLGLATATGKTPTAPSAADNRFEQQPTSPHLSLTESERLSTILTLPLDQQVRAIADWALESPVHSERCFELLRNVNFTTREGFSDLENSVHHAVQKSVGRCELDIKNRQLSESEARGVKLGLLAVLSQLQFGQADRGSISQASARVLLLADEVGPGLRESVLTGGYNTLRHLIIGSGSEFSLQDQLDFEQNRRKTLRGDQEDAQTALIGLKGRFRTADTEAQPQQGYLLGPAGS